MNIHQRLNLLSHEMGFDTPKARLLCEAADLLAQRSVQVFTRTTYGQMRIYPANATAERFLELTGNRTFSPGELAVIKQLGFTVEQVPDPDMVLG